MSLDQNGGCGRAIRIQGIFEVESIELGEGRGMI